MYRTGHMFVGYHSRESQYLLRVWMIQRSCSRGSVLASRKRWLKMQVNAWLLWVSCFYTWAEYSQRCTCQDICPTETGSNRGSKSRVKEHVRHGDGHKHTHHRSRPHRRKGESLTLTTSQTGGTQFWWAATCCTWTGAWFVMQGLWIYVAVQY